MKNRYEKYLPMFISAGMLLGMILGLILSVLKGDFGLWLSVGVGVGMALGAFSYLIFSAWK
jgi:hypothetical protein